MTEEERRSPLHDAQIAAGAEIIWEDGWPWAMTVGDTAQNEYEAIRTATGLWDLFSTVKYEVTGPDAGRLIQRRFTNDLSGVGAGQVRYGAFVNPDGLMVDDGNVYKHADEKFWVMINTADLEDWFRETADGLDARIVGRTEELPMISATGPTSRDLVQGLTDFDLSSLGYFRFNPEPVQVAGVPATVLRTGFSGELGFELVTDPGSAPALWEALIAAGGKPFGLEAIDIARVEAGLIIIALDYQPGETSPYDVSLDRFVKQGTENVGSEALAAVATNPPRRLKTLQIQGEAAPEAGATVTKDGEEVGTVTSPVVSPRLGTIALAVLATGCGERRREGRGGRGRRDRGAAQPLRSGEEAAAGLNARTAPATGEARILRGMDEERLVGVVPNFSEGRRADVIEAIVGALRVPGARVVYAEADPDHNRLDTTVLGPPAVVTASAMAGAAKAIRADRHVRAPWRPSEDGRGRRDPVHAGPRRLDGRLRRPRARLRPGAGGDVGHPGLPVRPGGAVAGAGLARGGPQGRVRGAARSGRARRTAARLRAARDRTRRRHGGGSPQAAGGVQRLPRRHRRSRGEGDRARRA